MKLLAAAGRQKKGLGGGGRMSAAVDGRAVITGVGWGELTPSSESGLSQGLL